MRQMFQLKTNTNHCVKYNIWPVKSNIRYGKQSVARCNTQLQIYQFSRTPTKHFVDSCLNTGLELSITFFTLKVPLEKL